MLRHAQIKENSIFLGRIYSDVLMSSRQYLPPGVLLSIHLRRAPEAFSLLSNKDELSYMMVIKSASVYIRRHRLPDALTKQVLSSIRGGQSLTFNRLETRLMSIPRTSTMFLWPNLLNGTPLPNRIYVAFVSHASLYGSQTRHSTYFENLNLATLNLKLNGRDLLVDPIRTKFVASANGEVDTSKSKWNEGLLSVVEVLNQVSDQTSPLRLSSDMYIKGMSIYAIELSMCGEESGNPGNLDLELTFGEGGTPNDAAVLVFSEKTDKAAFESI